MGITAEQRDAWNKQTAKDQHEWNKWLKVKEVIGPENTHAIAQACELAGKQFRVDEAAAEASPRIAEQFKTQAERCEKIAFWLEL